jgi:homoserine kinase
LPDGVDQNTALAAAAAVLGAARADFGVSLSVHKGIPLAAGMGGSAASAVAAAVAVNALLGSPFSQHQLFVLALEGERIASDPPHWDNVMASLLGGLVLAARRSPPLLAPLTPPVDITSILLHPAAKIETRAARSLLEPCVPLELLVEQSRRLGAFIAGCAANDHDLIRAGLEDVVVEPQRQHLLPILPVVKAAALSAGALGCSFSGSGPSVFAWAPDAAAAAVEDAMAWAFMEGGLAARSYCAPINSAGARVEQLAEAVH